MYSYDIIIVGGGIAGLYSAYKILKMAPQTKLLVLERYKKQWLGGRIGNTMFQGVDVVNGARVGRKEKDYLLIELLRELNIKCSESEVHHTYSNTISPSCNVKKVFEMLKKQFKADPVRKTFKEFAFPILGEKRYNHFIICSGYSDYENQDARDTFYNYGFDDNFDEWTALDIPCKKMIDSIADKIGFHNICFSSKVIHIEHPSACNFIIHTEKGISYQSCKVILATTISSVQKLFPMNPIYQQIHGQIFLRLYGKFTKDSSQIMKQYVNGETIVPRPLKKIIPMNAEKGVYMIAYTDNEDAKSLQDYLENTSKNRDHLCKLLEDALGIQDTLQLIAIKDFYWPIGTHYYEPLNHFKNRKEFIKTAQNPSRGMLVVGEMISMNQGWIQGALESVDVVVTQKWITDS